MNNSGASLSNVAGAKPLLETSRIGDRFDAALNQTSDLANRLSNVANRLMGNVPEALPTGVKDASGTTIPSSFIRATDTRFDSLNAELDRAFTALSRLESFA